MSFRNRLFLAPVLAMMIPLFPDSSHARQEADAAPIRVYVGTYTGGQAGSKGIYLMELDRRTGGARMAGLAAEVESPSFLAIHPDKQHLYAVSEITEHEGERTGLVHSFLINPVDGKLLRLSSQPTMGGAPCHLVVDKEGKNVLVANYVGGNATVLPLLPDASVTTPSATVQHEGKGPDAGRQEAPHAHSINLDAANRFALVADLGLDKVFAYAFDPEKGTLTPSDPPSASVQPGAGPRHLAFHPSGKYAYVNNEMASSVTAFRYDAEKGTLAPIHTLSTLPAGEFPGNSTAEVQVHPSGKFVYVSNRGHDTIAIFTVDEATGKLTAAGHQPTGGKTPRNFGIDPSGRFLLAANQDSDSVVVFLIDGETGSLKQVGNPYLVPRPVCVKFVTPGK
jgi:6-phosphogluconolactonase